MIQFLSIFFFVRVLQFLLGFSKVPVFFVSPCIIYKIVQVGEDSYVVLWSRHRTVRYVGITVLNEHAASFSTVEVTSKLF